MQKIKSFLYLDEYQLYSMASQMFEGITEYLIDYQRTTREEEESQRGPFSSGRFVANILQSESTKQQNKYLHDYTYTLFERELKNANAINDVSSDNIVDRIANIENASFIEVRAKAIFNDMNIIKATMDDFNELGEAFSLCDKL